MTTTPRPIRSSVSILGLLAAGILLASSFAPPVDPPISGRAASEAQGQDEETKLADAMSKMRGDMKQLRRELEGKDQAAAWKTVCSIQRHILDAKEETPEMAQSQPEPQRPAFVDSFRAKVSELLKRSCDLETAILAKKLDDAGDILGEMMGPMQKAGHKQFRSD